MAGRDGEAGAMAVLESILVGLLVLSAILFVTTVQKPLMAAETGGVNLGGLASQTMGLLKRHTFVHENEQLDLHDWVNRTMAGDTDVAAKVETYLRRVLPEGTEHALYLSNGVGLVRLVPSEDPGAPRNARLASIPFAPHWYEHRAQATPLVNSTWAAPGRPIDTAGNPYHHAFTQPAIQCVQGPDGSALAPDGGTWASKWKSPANVVPPEAPYGVWAGYPNADCTATAPDVPTYARVALRDGTITDHALYDLRLAVWFGA